MAESSALGSNSRCHTHLDWIDIARGITIVLVVLQHVSQGLVRSGLSTANSWYHVQEYAGYAFHMPVFFFLAGLHVERSLAKGKLTFLKTKAETLLYPYFLWSLLQGGMQLLLAGYVNEKVDAGLLVKILWNPIDQFWFLYSLLLCHLLFLLLPKRRQSILPAAVFFVVLNSVGRLPAYILRKTPHMRFFYALGVLLAELVKRSNLAKVPLVGVTACFGFAVSLFFALHLGYFYYSPGAIPAALFGVAGVLWISQSMRGWFASCFIYLGRQSMSIFLMHVLAAASVRIALKLAGVHAVMPHLILGSVAGVALPVLVYETAKCWNCLVLLGLQGRSAKKIAVERTRTGKYEGYLQEYSSVGSRNAR
jgi:fucose 4-O-acetylase-like acetyltransferase